MIYHHVQSRIGMTSDMPKFNTKCKECCGMRNDSGCGVRPGRGFLKKNKYTLSKKSDHGDESVQKNRVSDRGVPE